MPENNYLHFSPEEFAADPYFQAWVCQDDYMTHLFWENWLKDNPQKKGDIDLAKQLIAQLEFKDYQATTEDFNEVWKNLKAEQMETYSLPKPSRKIWYSVAAASVVLIISISFFFTRNNEPQFTNPIIVNNNIEAGSDKATLILETGEKIALNKETSSKIPNATNNGEKLIYDNTTSKEIAYNILTIPRGGQFQLALADGTQVWLNSETQIKYPVAFVNGKTRSVELIYGEAYFDVSPSTDHQGADFKVYHQEQEVQVLGTEFNIKAYKDETSIYTTLVEGKVSVNYKDGKERLVPNQQSNYNLLDDELTIAFVDVYNEISWKEGVFSFKDKPLKEIMKVLSRWYDIEVEFENRDAENEEFIGVLGKGQNIETILSNIKSFEIINNYEINNKKVILK